MPHQPPDPPPAAAELRTSHATPRPPHPDDPRVGIAANAIGWQLHRHDREVTEREDGNAQITVTAAEAAADRAAAERVVAHLDGYAASHAAEALDIRPGDTLIVRYPSHLTAPEPAVTAATAQLCGYRWPGRHRRHPFTDHTCEQPADHPPWPHGHRCRCGATTTRERA